MLYELDVDVDGSTWPNAGRPLFPPSFVPASRNTVPEQISLPEMLLFLGFLTTPIHASGVSLAEYWAWVRYLHAVDPSEDHLTLTNAFAGLDAHQKTILSDDFGVGLSMYWLHKKLNFYSVCDGAYFVSNLARRHGATVAPKVNKRGPSKAPDYVCLDTAGRYHVIECKGTQTNVAHRDRQLSHTAKSGPSGGVVQKRVIQFPPRTAGQRLACGTFLAENGSGKRSNMKIVDPDGPPILILDDQTIVNAFDPMLRSMVARAFVLTDLPSLAGHFASPDGFFEFPFKKRESGQRREMRAGFIEARRETAIAEIENAKSRRTTHIDGSPAVRRQLSIELVKPIVWFDWQFSRVHISQYCDLGAVERGFEEGSFEDPIRKDDKYWGAMIGAPILRSQPPTSSGTKQTDFSISLKIGKLSSTELVFRA